jgi:hypothetical protein
MSNDTSTKSTKPAGAKKPADRKPKAEDILEEEIAKEDLLADMPALKPPTKLRLAQRNRLSILLMDSGLIDEEDDDASDEDEDFDYRNPEHRAKIKDMLGLAAAIDEFAESIALDQAAYVEWAEGKDVDVFLAIFQRYTSAVGESNGSAS